MPDNRIRDEAERDLADAATWYEQQRAQLGVEFPDDVQSLLAQISHQPFAYPVLYRRTRRAVMHRFPF